MSKIKLQIKHRWFGNVLFEYESDNNSITATVLQAVKEKADLRSANLRSADLSGADLSGADLSGADLSGADLSGALNADIAIAMTRVCAEGDIIGYKKAISIDGNYEVIVELLIPSTAKRNNAFGRKCRAEFAQVMEINELISGKPVASARSSHDRSFTYQVGDVVTPTTPFNEDFTNECSTGIHFFITRLEAVNY